MKEQYQKIEAAIKELGYSIGLIRASALLSMTIGEVEEIYFQHR